jgi:uncharacterized repeat protein (TIGR01451 family)
MTKPRLTHCRYAFVCASLLWLEFSALAYRPNEKAALPALPSATNTATARPVSADQLTVAAAASASGLTVEWHPRLGTPISIRANNLGQKQAYSGGKGLAVAPTNTYEQNALAVLDNLSRFYALTDAAKEFAPKPAEADTFGFHHVRLRQVYQGLRVFGGDLVVHFDASGTAYQVNGDYVPKLQLEVKPKLDADTALARAAADLASLGKPAGTPEKTPELVVFARESDPRLAYELTLAYTDAEKGPARWRYWVDALEGQVLLRYNDIQRIAAPTANGSSTTITGTILAHEGGQSLGVAGWYENTGYYYLYNTNLVWYVYNVATTGSYTDLGTYAYRSSPAWGTSDPAEMSAARNLDLVQRYYAEVHGRSSFNNARAYARANVHQGVNYVNAYWDGTALYFGDGDNVTAGPFSVLDVCGHEFTHAVDQYTADLVYSGESGALNESFSDIMGTCVEFWAEPDGRSLYPSKSAGTADWLCGEDCWLASTALRDMRNPHNTATVGAGNEQPSRYKGTYWDPAQEVHQNDGVQNFFFYLLAEGGSGTNDGLIYNVTGIGITNAQRVAYRALTVYATPNTSYQTARSAWVSAALDYNTTWAASAAAAWSAVGVSPVQLAPTSLAFRGPVGGPFTPTVQTCAVSNLGATSFDWGVTQAPAWATVAPSSGTCPAYGSNVITFSINSAANSLATGLYSSLVTFSNSLESTVQSCGLSLGVGQLDYYTERFDTSVFDLAYQSFTFTPSGGANFYDLCHEFAATNFPTDPTGGTVLSLSDDSCAAVTLTGTNTVAIYQTRAGVLYVGSNGYITLGSGDTSISDTLTYHFNRPRVSALFDDLYPSANVTWKQLTNRVAVTFSNVREFGKSNTNSFQIELFFDGTIRLTYLRIDAAYALAGLSAGQGVPAGFVQSDLSSYGSCSLPLTLTVPASATEGDGVLTNAGRVLLPAALTTNLTVSLTSSDTTEATVPASLTIPAGQTNGTFDITIIDDGQLDGPQTAIITASVPGYLSATAALTVQDSQSTALHVSLPAEATEGDGSVVGTVWTTNAPSANVSVSLSSSDTTEVQVPPAVILPAGQTSVVFTATIVDDTQIDGDQTALITAHVQNWTDGTALIAIHDNETTNLVLTLPAYAREGDGVLSNAGLVRISGTWPSNLTVTLVSDNTNELTVPRLVTISAGQTAAYFNLTIGHDPALTGAQMPTVTATAPGFAAGSRLMTIYDYECPPVPSNPSPADLASNIAPLVSLSWQSGAAPGEFITNDVYLGTNPTPGPAELAGTTTNTTWVCSNLLAPLTTYYWQVVARKAGSTPGPVWRFTTLGVDHFSFSAIPSPQYVNQPFTVTVAALDSSNRVVTNFTSAVGLSASSGSAGLPAGGVVPYFSDNNVTATGLAGPIALVGFTPLQVINVATLDLSSYRILVINEVDNSLVSSALSARLAAIQAWVAAGGCLVIHDRSTGDLTPDPFLLGTSGITPVRWTTNNVDVIPPGSNLVVAGPFGLISNTSLDGGSSSAHGYILQNQLPALSEPILSMGGYPNQVVAFSYPLGLGHIYYCSIPLDCYLAGGGCSSPATLATTLQQVYMPNVMTYALALLGGGAVPITPTNSATFVNGSWTGNLTCLAPATNVLLHADDGNGHNGTANPFDVLLENDLSLTVVDSPHPVSVGANLTYTLTVANTGPAPATGVVVTNQLPATVNFLSATSSQGTCTQSGGVVTCNLGTVPGATNATVMIVAIPTVAGITVTNIAQVTRAEADAYLPNNFAINATPVSLPAISIADAACYEGNVGRTSLVFNVSLAAPSAQVIQVNYFTTNGSATAGSDYLATNGVLSFAPGVTNQTLSVAILGDTVIEPDETFLVMLTNPLNGVLGRSQALGTILNDDGLPGQVDHFVWSNITSPQYVSVPTPVTVSAVDAFNSLVTNFAGPVNLSASTSGSAMTNILLGTIPVTSYSSGTYTMGFQFTPSTNLTVTHVRSYSGTKVSIWTDTGALLASQAVSGPNGTWTETPLPTPLQLSAGTSYRVGFYTGGGYYYYSYTFLTSFPFGTLGQSYYATGDAFPTSSSTSTRYLVDLRYTVGSDVPIPVAPTLSGTFTNGAWSGDLACLAPGTNVLFAADDGNGHSGASNPFGVLTQNDLSLALAANPSPAAPFELLEYTLTVANSGPAAATGVVLTNWLPAGVAFVTAYASQGSWTQADAVVRCDLGDMPGGASATLNILVQPLVAGTQLTNSASVSRAEHDPYLGNNSALSLTVVGPPSVSIADASAPEGNVGINCLSLAVALSAPSAQTVTVNYSTVNGTAIAGADYVATNGVLTFLPGQTNRAICVGIIGNTQAETDKSFYVDLSSATNALIGKREALGTILNDDGFPGQIDHFAWGPIASPQVAGAPFAETITALDAFNNPALTFNGTATLSAWAGGAGAATNYLLGNLPYYNYSYSYYTCGYSFTPTNDLLVTHVRAYSGYKVSIWTDAGVLLASQSLSGSSGAWGETPLATPLQLTAGTCYRVGVYASYDYVFYSSSQTLTNFPDGTLNQGYYYYGDGFPNSTTTVRWFMVDLRYVPKTYAPISVTPPVAGPFTNGVWSGNLAVIGYGSNIVLKADDGNGHSGSSSPPFQVQLVDDVALAMADSPRPVCLGANLLYTLTVTNTGPASATGLSVTNLLPGGATFVSANASQGSSTLAGNVLSWQVGSLGAAGSATLTVTITPTTVGTLTNQATIWRAETDPYLGNNTATLLTPVVSQPSASINDLTVMRGSSGTTNAVFTVSLWPPPALTASVSYLTANGTATAPADYLSTNGTLLFALGETNKTISVVVNGSTLYCPSRTFYVNLSALSNVLLSRSQAAGTISNTVPMPSLSIGDATVVEGNSGAANALFPVTLSGPSSLTTTVYYNTVDGSALSGSDFTYTSGYLTLPPLVTSTNISVPIIGDTVIEPDETFYVDLSSPANATLAKREGVGTILNDDGLPGQVDHFVWGTLASTQYVGQPFLGTIAAVDAFNNPALVFNGMATLSVASPFGGGTNTILGGVGYTYYGSGSYTLGYSFTPTNNLTVTHLRSFFGTKVSLWTQAGALLASLNVTGTPGTWSEMALPAPVSLAAGAHYRLAAYTGGGNYYYRYDGSNSFPGGTIDAGYEASGDAFPTTSDSARWWLVDLRYTTGYPNAVPITPTLAGPFINGIWTGNLTLLAPATNANLRADDAAGHNGLSAPLTVLLRNDLSVALTDAPHPVALGADITYTITVSNSGPASSTGVTFTNWLPAGVVFVSAVSSQGTCTGSGSLVTGVLDTLPAASNATVVIAATVNEAGNLTNRVSVYRAEPDPYPDDNTAVTVTPVAAPALSINDVSVLEGNFGATNAVFTVTLWPPSVQTVVVNYSTADGTATAPSDYLGGSGTLTFAPGETNLPLTVIVNGDTNPEPNEIFFVNLYGATNANYLKPQGIGTILNDDLWPSIGVFYDSRYVDTTSGGYSAEASNVVASLQLAGFLTTTFTNIATATQLNRSLLFPEFEVGDLSAALSASDRVALSNFVVQGRVLIVHGDNDNNVARFLNLLFGLAVSESAQSSGGVTYQRTLQANGTAFATDPATIIGNNGTSTLATNTLPPGALSLYESSGQSAVALIPRGAGAVVFLGWDWYNAVPIGGSDNGWLAVLDTAAGLQFNPQQPPLITTQPASVTAPIGAPVSFSVIASGDWPLSYQWRRNATPLSGATTATLSIPSVQASDAGSYTVVVTNAFGSVTSAPAILAVTVDHFAWGTVASPQFAGVPFPVTIQARDGSDALAVNFTGVVSLSGITNLGAPALQATFETGLEGFATNNSYGLGNGLWHLSTGRGSQAGHSSTHSLYYGFGEGPSGGGSYNLTNASGGVANEGVVVSPLVDLRGATAAPVLSFNYLLQSEPGTSWDHATVEGSTNGGASYTILASNNQGGVPLTNNTGGQWRSASISFSNYIGSQMLLRFHFNTVDGGANNYEGWYIDDITLTGNGPSVALAVIPANTATFSNGVWSGTVTVPVPVTNLMLRADDGAGHAGISGGFNVQLGSDLRLSATGLPATVFVGDHLSYSLAVSNAGPAAVTGTILTDNLPPGLSVLSVTSSQGTWNRAGDVCCVTLGTLAPGASAQVSITGAPTLSGSLTNLATVAAIESDPNPADNSAAVVTTVIPKPVLGYAIDGRYLVLTWTGPWSLLSATNVSGPYLPVSGASSPYRVDTRLAQQQFFRLQSTLGRLSISRVSADQVALAWSGLSVLQFSTNGVCGPYWDLPSATSPFTNSIDARQKSFRLKN